MTTRTCIFSIAAILTCLVVSANGANILGVFPSPSLSHHILGSALLKELARRGHNVTMFSPFEVDEPLANYTDVTLQNMKQIATDTTPKIIKKNTFNEQMEIYIEIVTKIFNSAMEQEVTRSFLRSDSKFDVILFDMPCDSLFGLMDRFDAPGIIFSPFGDMPFLTAYTGNTYQIPYVPVGDTISFSDLKSFKGRLDNLLEYWQNWLIGFRLFRPVIENMHKKHFPNAPALNQLIKKISLVLLNSHFTHEHPRPYTPNVVHIGGFNMANMQPIEPDMKKWLDDAKEGVIVVSFGTKVTGKAIVHENLSTVLLNTFRKLKYKVLWKFGDELENVPNNIRIEKWIQQREILTHPNVKLFITHGGMGGFTEAIYAGVPMIGMPFYGDQKRNIMNAVEFGYGVSLNWKSVTEETLEAAIKEVTENPKYDKIIQAASDAFRNQPINPIDKAVFYVEHVIRHKGADHLKPASLKLSLTQRLLLDVLGFIFGIITLILSITYFCLKMIYKCCCKRKLKMT